MLLLISPSKNMDFSPSRLTTSTSILFPEETMTLVKVMQKKKANALAKLMDVSEKIALLNESRYQSFSDTFTTDNAKQAILAFTGDVYQGLETAMYDPKDFDFAQKHLRILSGLYGLLRPLDLIQPYRLEMGLPVKVGSKTNLYGFWGDKITKAANEALAESGSEYLINLASIEYFSAIKPQKINGKVLTIHFKEMRNGKLQTIALNSKRARGMMANFIIRNGLILPEQLKAFDKNGYQWQATLSDDTQWTFVKEH